MGIDLSKEGAARYFTEDGVLKVGVVIGGKECTQEVDDPVGTLNDMLATIGELRREKETSAAATLHRIEQLVEKSTGASKQIEELANYIMFHVDGEPSEDEGAGDCAVRIMKIQADEIKALKKQLEGMEQAARCTECRGTGEMESGGEDGVCYACEACGGTGRLVDQLGGLREFHEAVKKKNVEFAAKLAEADALNAANNLLKQCELKGIARDELIVIGLPDDEKHRIIEIQKHLGKAVNHAKDQFEGLEVLVVPQSWDVLSAKKAEINEEWKRVLEGKRHVTEAQWLANRASTPEEHHCPCDHWAAPQCETCRGACSCHWLHEKEGGDADGSSGEKG